MPIRYRCKHCGHVLYEFKGVGQSYIGAPSPLEVIKLVGHICPSCKRILELPRGNFKDYILIRTRDIRVPSIQIMHSSHVELRAVKT
ncbi:MAG: hypothetical protein QW816_06455 [Desulfurococcaceae archaeon]